MRAKTVNEYQSFNRGAVPKRALGLGPDPRIEEAFVPLLLQALPEILGTREIPSDIIIHNLSYINPMYQKRLSTWVDSYISRRLSVDVPVDETVETLGYNIWKSLHYRLKGLGYSDETGLDESASFVRGAVPKRSMGLGIRPEDPESFIPYLIRVLPEILGTPEIPEDILGDRSYYIHRKYHHLVYRHVVLLLGVDEEAEGFRDYAILPYDLWPALYDGLRERGYTT